MSEQPAQPQKKVCELRVKIVFSDFDENQIVCSAEIPQFFEHAQIIFTMARVLYETPGAKKLASDFSLALVQQWMAAHLPGPLVETRIVDSEFELAPKTN